LSIVDKIILSKISQKSGKIGGSYIDGFLAIPKQGDMCYNFLMKKRVFLAIELPEEVRNRISGFYQKLAKYLPAKGVKPVEEENLHLTLHFLGDQNEAKISQITEVARKTAGRCAKIKLSTGGLSAFPNERFPKILFLDLKLGGEALKRLHGDLGAELQKIGVDVDCRPWEGHITLARIKFGAVNFGTLKKEPAAEEEWLAEKFALVESRLMENGPIYGVMENFKFGYES
jgi:2'-5' RNA ligase